MVRLRSRIRYAQEGRSQGGYSLIEVLVALFLISVLVIALVNGLLTSTQATTVSNRSQRAGAALTSFGETLKQMDYVPCADANNYQVDYENMLNDPDYAGEDFGTSNMDSVTVDKVEYWKPGSFAENSASTTVLGEFIDTCDYPEGGSQRITYTVHWAEKNETGEVVKRDPYAGGFVAETTTTALPPSSQRPIARFTASPMSGNRPLTVHFDATDEDTGSYDPNGVITKYEWDWDEGGSPVEAGGTPSHTFNNPGKYLVVLTVSDNETPALKATTRLTINVTGKPATPTGLHRSGSGSLALLTGYLDLTWNPVPGAENYQIHTETAGCSTTMDAGRSTTIRLTTNTWCSFLNLLSFFNLNLKAQVRVRAGSEWSDWSPKVDVSWFN